MIVWTADGDGIDCGSVTIEALERFCGLHAAAFHTALWYEELAGIFRQYDLVVRESRPQMSAELLNMIRSGGCIGFHTVAEVAAYIMREETGIGFCTPTPSEGDEPSEYGELVLLPAKEPWEFNEAERRFCHPDGREQLVSVMKRYANELGAEMSTGPYELAYQAVNY